MHELLGRGVVQACDVDSVEVAEHFQVPSPERLDTAAAAEVVVNGVTAELVICESILSLQQPKRVSFDDGLPEPRLVIDPRSPSSRLPFGFTFFGGDSHLNDRGKAAVEHPLHIEEGLLLHEGFHSWVVHRLLIDLIAMGL